MEKSTWVKILIVFVIGLLAGYLFATQTNNNDVEEEVEEVMEEEEEVAQADELDVRPTQVISPTFVAQTEEAEETEESEENALTAIDTIGISVEAGMIEVFDSEGRPEVSGSSVQLGKGESHFVRITTEGLGLVDPSLMIDGNALASYSHLPMGADSVAEFEIEYQGDELGYRFHKIDFDVDGDGNVEENLSWKESISLDSYLSYMNTIVEASSFTNHFKKVLAGRIQQVGREGTTDSIETALREIELTAAEEADKDIAVEMFEAIENLI